MTNDANKWMPLLQFVEKSEPIGISWTELWKELNKNTIGSKETLSKLLKYFEDCAFIRYDHPAKKYHVTKKGKKLVRLQSNIAVLSRKD